MLSFNGARSVAHEIAHTCAVWHHGDTDQQVDWKRFFLYEGGKVTASASENGQPITELREDGSLQNPVIIDTDVWIGVPQGQHSGDADCMMRYVNARAYRSQANPNDRYLVQEVPGFTLCTSGTGTGINEAGHTPQSRYGDAATNRGNCKDQICVNDLYNHGPNHSR